MLNKEEISVEISSAILIKYEGRARDILVMCDKLISFSMKSELRKLFFVIRVLEVLHDP